MFLSFPLFSVFPQLLNIYVGDQDDINQVLETSEYFETCWFLCSNHSHITSVTACHRRFGTIVQLQCLRIVDDIQAFAWRLPRDGLTEWRGPRVHLKDLPSTGAVNTLCLE